MFKLASRRKKLKDASGIFVRCPRVGKDYFLVLPFVLKVNGVVGLTIKSINIYVYPP